MSTFTGKLTKTGTAESSKSLVSALAWGEGWHDWHHMYPYDSAAAECHWLRQFNPTYALLDLCAALGLVHHRKRAVAAWQRRVRSTGHDGAVPKSANTWQYKVLGGGRIKHDPDAGGHC